MALDEKDVILNGLRDITPALGAQVALQLVNVEVQSPRLSEAEVDAIAEKVAARLAELAQRSKASGGQSWKPKLKKVAYDLAMGVSGSALYAVIEYLAHKAPVMLAGPEDSPVRPDEGRPKRTAVLDQIEDPDMRKTVETVLDHQWLQEMIEREARKRLANEPTVSEFTQALTDASKRDHLSWDVDDHVLRSISNAVFDEIFAKARSENSNRNPDTSGSVV